MANDRLSLYIGLEEGRSADLGVIAGAALAWEDLIKEVFSLIDPDAAVRIELINSSEGSLKLNAIIRATSRVKGQNPKTVAAIWAIILFFALAPAVHLQGDLGQWILAQIGHQDGLNEEQKKDVYNAAMRALRDNAAKEQKRAIFAELAHDPAITSVGVTIDPAPRVKPTAVVPRSEFARLSGDIREDAPIERRTVRRTISATLVSPVLKGEARAWRFQENYLTNEFSATMADPKMLAALAEPHGVTVSVGTEMTFDVSDREEKKDGAWCVIRRTIKRVHNPELLNEASQLPLDEYDESTQQQY